MYIWFVYAVWLLSAYLTGIYFSALFPARFNKLNKRILPVFMTALMVIPAYIRAAHSDNMQSLIYVVCNYTEILIMIVVLLVLYKGSLWKKILAYGVMSVMICVSQLITNVVVLLIGEPYDMSFNSPMMMLYVLLGNFMVFVLLIPVISVWKRCLGESGKVNYIGFLGLSSKVCKFFFTPLSAA